MQQFYIMKAVHLTSSGRKLGLAKVAREQGPCTIILAKRHYGWTKSVECTITGAQGSYGVQPGDTAVYTIDTGNGYKCRGSRLDIHHILQVNSDGMVIESDGEKCAPTPIPTGVNRYTWVMK